MRVIVRSTVVVSALAFAVILSGCEKQPASIKVKGPRDALESVKTVSYTHLTLPTKA